MEIEQRNNILRKCGLENPFSMGKSINDGYTELLVERYYNYVEENSTSFEYKIVSYLEIIIGKYIMEDLFINSSLDGLISELEKYTKREDIIKFITSFDLVNKNKYRLDILSKSNFKRFNDSIVYIYNFLFKTYAKKVRLDYNNYLITKKDVLLLLEQFISSLGHSVYFGSREFIYFSSNDASRMLREIIDTDNNVNLEYSLMKK